MPDFKSFWRINLPRGWTLLPLRLLIGTGFLVHGLAKWNRGPAKFGLLLQHADVPFPFQTAWLVICLEVFGGAAVLVGLFVTILSVPLIISMLVAIFTVQGRFGFSSINTIGLTPSGPCSGRPGTKSTCSISRAWWRWHCPARPLCQLIVCLRVKGQLIVDNGVSTQHSPLARVNAL